MSGYHYLRVCVGQMTAVTGHLHWLGMPGNGGHYHTLSPVALHIEGCKISPTANLTTRDTAEKLGTQRKCSIKRLKCHFLCYIGKWLQIFQQWWDLLLFSQSAHSERVVVTARGNCCVRARLQDVSGQGAGSSAEIKMIQMAARVLERDGDEQKIPSYGQT